MAVLLPNTVLGVRRFVEAQEEDAYGFRASAGLGDVEGPWPGSAREDTSNQWIMRVAPEAWPVRAGDVIVEVGGPARSWTVVRSDLLEHSIDPSVNYVRVESHLRRDGGTEVFDSPTPPNRTGENVPGSESLAEAETF